MKNPGMNDNEGPKKSTEKLSFLEVQPTPIADIERVLGIEKIDAKLEELAASWSALRPNQGITGKIELSFGLPDQLIEKQEGVPPMEIKFNGRADSFQKDIRELIRSALETRSDLVHLESGMRLRKMEYVFIAEPTKLFFDHEVKVRAREDALQSGTVVYS